MRNLKFKYLKAVNFLCFGEEGIEINFESYGNIVLIKGKNLDVNDEEGVKASNGSGKTACLNSIVYALYGKTVSKPKKINHEDLINNKSGGNLEVEFIWDDYRVVRTRGDKDSLHLWQSAEGIWNKDTKISVGGIPATQKELEKKLGLTYDSFINIFVFSDDNALCFLEYEKPKQREIVENLLSLDKYRNYSDNAGNLTKDLKKKIKDLSKEYDDLDKQKTDCINRIKQVEKQEVDWYTARKKELTNILNEIKMKRDELDKSKTGAALAIYQETQEEIKDLKQKIPELEMTKNKLQDILATASDKSKLLDENIQESQKKLKIAKKGYEECEELIGKNEKIIKDIESKSGKECPYCLSLVDEKNFADMLVNAKKVIEEKTCLLGTISYEVFKNEYNNLLQSKSVVDKGILDFKSKVNKIESTVSDIYCSISKLSKIEKPDTNLNDLLLSEQIENLKKHSVEKQEELNGLTPFETIKQSAVSDLSKKITECNQKEEEVKQCEEDLPYYEFWVKAFGDTGIRKYVIDGIIPTLNDRIEYWLQFLIDNKIKLTFNNELKETIDRYPFNNRPYVYPSMSGGQRRRLNLTVSQSWAYITALSSGAAPSVVFLDEVSMNMDEVGVQGIYRMICELAKEKQVFVIDHNESLLQMLDGCDTIYLEMKDEVSRKLVDTFGKTG